MASTLSLFGGYHEDLKRARAALNAHRFDEALVPLQRYRGLLSVEPDFTVLYAEILDRMGNYAEQEAILARLLEVHPGHAQSIVLRAVAMTGLGRRAEAVALLDQARADQPANTDIVAAYLPILLAERGLAAAIAALSAEHHRRTPPRRLERAVEKLRMKALALHDPDEIRRLDPENLLELEPSGNSEAYSLRHIYEMFEPIGCNCEFGFVQRRSGAEPLSLFRWTAITPEKLSELLACDLEDYDNPAHYSLSGIFGHEFLLAESLFGTKTHTGVNQSDVAPDEFLARMTRRQAFLKRKFLADAAQGRKIFTYKADGPLSEDQMAAIETQLVRLGVRQCLFAMPTDDRAKAGTVEIASRHRSIGYLSAVMPDTQYEEWNRIAIAVYDRFVRNAEAA